MLVWPFALILYLFSPCRNLPVSTWTEVGIMRCRRQRSFWAGQVGSGVWVRRHQSFGDWKLKSDSMFFGLISWISHRSWMTLPDIYLKVQLTESPHQETGGPTWFHPGRPITFDRGFVWLYLNKSGRFCPGSRPSALCFWKTLLSDI